MAASYASPPREYELRDRGRAQQRPEDAAVALAIDSNIAATRRRTRREEGMASQSPTRGLAPAATPTAARQPQRLMREWFPPYAPAAGLLRAAAVLAALAALLCMLPYSWPVRSAAGRLCASGRAMWRAGSAFALFSFWVAFREGQHRRLHAAAWLIGHVLAGSVIGGCVLRARARVVRCLSDA
jgi:hypothetical protein